MHKKFCLFVKLILSKLIISLIVSNIQKKVGHPIGMPRQQEMKSPRLRSQVIKLQYLLSQHAPREKRYHDFLDY